MSNDYCFRRAAQGQLSKCNRGNTVSVLRAVAKSHKDLKGAKVLACRCSGSNLKNFSKLTGKSPCWSSFVVKLQPGRAYYKKVKVKVTPSPLSKKRRLHRDSYTRTFL